MSYAFQTDERLGIPLPVLHMEWEQYSEKERSDIIYKWEVIRGRIPNRVAQLERIINEKQALLYEEEDFPTSCRLNSEIAELASCINDLHLWYRVNQDVAAKIHR
ncbi:hypothetical protein PAE9249_00059 [Paenibacillus sp. CECT 9249]|uniref:hypothetical protein n=1 Tax=Paenibacillus sp. CECT 9249 TaxID=2845385 RepID=UPI001E55CE91|nr:hypothetical protein [Paenibacillus sp. CECT 9249]CAH0117599.1 hypothetical protein PAE9249_00059 [Paenibacillus sp. CECT 9249]